MMSERAQRPTGSLHHLYHALLFHSLQKRKKKKSHDALNSVTLNNSSFEGCLLSFLEAFISLSSSHIHQTVTRGHLKNSVWRWSNSKHHETFQDDPNACFYFVPNLCFPLLFWCKPMTNSLSQCASDYIHSSNCSRANKSYQASDF